MQAQRGKPVEEAKPEGFDLRTHYWDRETKRLSHINPYRLHTIDGVQYFERPKGSGNVFWKDGAPAGVIDLKSMQVDLEASHVEWVAPLTQEQKEQEEVRAVLAQNEELRRELEMIKKDKEPVVAKSGEKNGNKVSDATSVKSGLGGDGASLK